MARSSKRRRAKQSSGAARSDSANSAQNPYPIRSAKRVRGSYSPHDSPQMLTRSMTRIIRDQAINNGSDNQDADDSAQQNGLGYQLGPSGLGLASCSRISRGSAASTSSAAGGGAGILRSPNYVMHSPAISRLTDDCLLLIFDRCTIIDLLAKLPRVCKRWHRLHRRACLGRKRVSLVIDDRHQYIRDNIYRNRTFGYSILGRSSGKPPSPGSLDHTFEPQDCNNFPGPENAVLHLGKLTRTNTRGLTEAFPHLTHFDLVQFLTSGKPFHQVLFLLDQWSRTLTNLRIFSEYSPKTSDGAGQLFRLFKFINQKLVALKSLTLYDQSRLIMELNDADWPKSIDKGLDLSVLGRLEEFYFDCNDSFDALQKSLRSYAISNPRLKRIAIGNWITNLETFGAVLQLPQELTAKFTDVTIDVPNFAEDHPTLLHLHTLANRFTNLTSLTIFMFHNAFFDVARTLQPIKNLTYLSIQVEFQDGYDGPLANSDRIAIEDVPTLAAIQQLKLHMTYTSHVVLNSKHLGRMFPWVKLVHIQLYEQHAFRCDECNYEYDPPPNEYNKVHIAVLQQCGLNLVKPWQHLDRPADRYAGPVVRLSWCYLCCANCNVVRVFHNYHYHPPPLPSSADGGVESSPSIAGKAPAGPRPSSDISAEQDRLEPSTSKSCKRIGNS